jgi:hypothetical protein
MDGCADRRITSNNALYYPLSCHRPPGEQNVTGEEVGTHEKGGRNDLQPGNEQKANNIPA